jgi:hypothetical protein
MLWTVRHEGAQGSPSTATNTGHAQIRNNGNGTFIHSKEGVTQETASMFAYGVGLSPHSCSQGIFPAVDQTWYADDAGAGGKFNAIKQFAKLQEIGPHYGYYPEPTKSILLISFSNLPAATAAST